MGLVSASHVSSKLAVVAFPKIKRVVDEEYVRWLHGWPCCVSSCRFWPVHAHHVRSKGAGGGDDQCVPLCAFHHVVGPKAVHKIGVKTFQSLFQVSLECEAQAHFARYQQKIAPPHHVAGADCKVF